MRFDEKGYEKLRLTNGHLLFPDEGKRIWPVTWNNALVGYGMERGEEEWFVPLVAVQWVARAKS